MVPFHCGGVGNWWPWDPTSLPYAPLAPEGQQLPTTPKWKGTMTARYAFPLAGMQAHVQGNFTYQSAIWPNLLTDERTVLGQQSAYGIANFSFGLARDTYALELLVKNEIGRAHV